MTRKQLGAEAHTNDYRRRWVMSYAIMMVWIGAAFEALLFVMHPYQPVVLADFGHLLAWAAVSLLVVLGAPVHVLARSLVVALSVGAAMTLWSIGFLGPTGPLLCFLPICATILLGKRWSLPALALAAILYITFGLLHATGRVAAQGSFRTDSVAAWIIVTFSFMLVVATVVSLVGHLLRDLEVVSKEFEEAREGLITAGELRSAAERARDAALTSRAETRSVEALGVVAGSVVHDLRNMAQVIRTWADEVTRTGSRSTSSEAGAAIMDACDRLTALAGDVLSLGNTPPSSEPEVSLADSLPSAARALRRFLREDMRIVVDSDVPRGLPPLPVSSVDLVHIVLEAAAMMSITSIGRGTLVVSAPRAAAAEGPPPIQGTRRYPALLSLELRRDSNVKSTRQWFLQAAPVAACHELANVPEARVVLWCPDRDTGRIAFDIYDQLPDSTQSGRFRALLRGGA